MKRLDRARDALRLARVRLKIGDIHFENRADRLQKATVHNALVNKTRKRLLQGLLHRESADAINRDIALLEPLQCIFDPRRIASERHSDNDNLLVVRRKLLQHFRKPALADSANIRHTLQRPQGRCRRNGIFLPAPTGQNQRILHDATVLLSNFFGCMHCIISDRHAQLLNHLEFTHGCDFFL